MEEMYRTLKKVLSRAWVKKYLLEYIYNKENFYRNKNKVSIKIHPTKIS